MERVTGATAASGVPQKPHGHSHPGLVAPGVTAKSLLGSTPKFSRRGSWKGMSNSLTNRRPMSNDAVGHGLIGSFRRLSFDQLRALEEVELVNDNQTAPSFSINEYQKTFQQMKQENPTISMGALQQMTMTKIAELNAAKEQEVARERNIQQRKNEEERLRNRPPSKKCVDRWVGNMRSNYVHQEHHCRKSDSDLGGSRLTNNLATSNTNTANARGPFKMLRRNSADLLASSRRRNSMDSTAGTETTLSNEDHLLYINAGLVPGGDDQGDNFAVRRSIGSEPADSNVDASDDMDDKSIQSFLSEFSDGLFDSTRSLYSRSELSGLRSWLGDSNGSTKLVADDESVGIDDEEIWNESFEKKICVITDKLISVDKSSIEIMRTRKMSDVSDCSTYYSGAGSDGLIVDFTDRSDLRAGLIVGFGQRSRPGKERYCT